MDKKNRIAIIVAVIVGLAIIGGVIAMKNKKSDSKDQKQGNPDSSLFAEEEMEAFCQEDHLADISGYFTNMGIDYAMINALNYNKYFNAEYQHTMDDAKRPVALLSWNGKNKDTGGVISFMCWAAKIDGQKKLLLLETSGQTIRGDASSIYGD